MHVLYMKGGRERRKRQQQAGEKDRKRDERAGKMAGMRGRVEMWDLQKRIKKKQNDFGARGRRG